MGWFISFIVKWYKLYIDGKCEDLFDWVSGGLNCFFCLIIVLEVVVGMVLFVGVLVFGIREVFVVLVYVWNWILRC